MSDKDQKYNELIALIKANKPALDHPEILTSEIMSAVGKLPLKAKSSRSLKFISWVSSVAAVLLVGLFLSERSVSTVPSTQDIHISTYGSSFATEVSSENGNTLNMIHDVVKEKREFNKRRESFYVNLIKKSSNY